MPEFLDRGLSLQNHPQNLPRLCKLHRVLDFSLVGVLSKLSGILAEHQIGIFAVSTYNTDYILVKEENYEQALGILISEGYIVD